MHAYNFHDLKSITLWLTNVSIFCGVYTIHIFVLGGLFMDIIYPYTMYTMSFWNALSNNISYYYCLYMFNTWCIHQHILMFIKMFSNFFTYSYDYAMKCKFSISQIDYIKGINYRTLIAGFKAYRMPAVSFVYCHRTYAWRSKAEECPIPCKQCTATDLFVLHNTCICHKCCMFVYFKLLI